MKDGLQKALELINEGIKEGLDEYAQMMEPIIEENTPLDTGRLRKSEKVEDLRGGMGKRFSADTPYARKQHETLYYQHTFGRAKYILAPLTETQEQANEIIRKKIKEKLDKG